MSDMKTECYVTFLFLVSPPSPPPGYFRNFVSCLFFISVAL